MTVKLLPSGVICLEGECQAEDAETLLQLLLAAPTAVVDWQACVSAHTAVIQVLLFGRRAVNGAPAGPALRDWVYPLLLSSITAG